MATIDKQSVRDEFEKAKVKFKNLIDEGKISPEAAMLFDSFIMLLNIVLSIFLEKTTKKTSTNSNIPSSQTEKDKSFTTNNKSNGKGKRETITTIGNTRTVETITTIPVDTCAKCGKSLKKIKCQCIERRTCIDIIFEKTVEHIDAEVKECPSCGMTTKACFPEGMAGPLQYGNGIKAFVIQLLVMQMMTLNRVSKMMVSFVGKMISEATLLSYIMRLHIALEEWEINTKQQILSEKCIHVDETSLRVDKKNNWIHVYSAGDIVLKFLHKNRGKTAIEDVNIIPKYHGVIVHDCWASYFSYGNCAHGLCGSHILRELTFIVDAHGYQWAKNMKRLLKLSCKMVSGKKIKCLNEKDFERLSKCYRDILRKGKEELPIIPEKSDESRRRIAKSDAHNLWERLEKHEVSVLLFAKLSHVPFTNNRAEQDLRMSKVKQKVSGCFRVKKYAQAYCRISSYLQTMKNKGINPIVAVNMAFSGKVSL